jgi:hypothetical protein
LARAEEENAALREEQQRRQAEGEWLRHRGGQQLGPAASPAHPPHPLAGPPGRAALIEGTLIGLQVDHLPGDRDPKPVWLWSSRATAADVDRWWQSFLRRFDLEHTFRLFKQTLAWTRPKLRTPQAADRWTWSSPATPNCASPGRWPTTSAAPGSAPPPRAGSPRSGPPRVPEHPREDHPSG